MTLPAKVSSQVFLCLHALDEFQLGTKMRNEVPSSEAMFLDFVVEDGGAGGFHERDHEVEIVDGSKR